MSSELSLLTQQTLQEVRRRLIEESIPRLRKCLGELSEAEIWSRPNTNSNSVGNLVLHLCGNARQWMISTFGQQRDIRQRNEEFTERGPLPTQHLLDELDHLERALIPVLETITAEDLTKSYSVQGFSETGIAILIHVVEHFSYHVGQVSYFVKAHKDLDLGYYAGLDLNKKELG